MLYRDVQLSEMMLQGSSIVQWAQESPVSGGTASRRCTASAWATL